MLIAALFSVLLLHSSQKLDSLQTDNWLENEWNQSYNQAYMEDFSVISYVHLIDQDGVILYRIQKDDIISGIASSKAVTALRSADYLFSASGDDYYLISDDLMLTPALNNAPYSSLESPLSAPDSLHPQSDLLLDPLRDLGR